MPLTKTVELVEFIELSPAALTALLFVCIEDRFPTAQLDNLEVPGPVWGLSSGWITFFYIEYMTSDYFLVFPGIHRPFFQPKMSITRVGRRALVHLHSRIVKVCPATGWIGIVPDTYEASLVDDQLEGDPILFARENGRRFKWPKKRFGTLVDEKWDYPDQDDASGKFQPTFSITSSEMS